MKHWCDYCQKYNPNLKMEDGWQMQHLHYEDEVIQFLTCETCKLLSPTKFMEKIKSDWVGDWAN